MIFGYLLLAHMLGDFVFQPGRLVAWKIRSKIGIAVHALVHFAITILLFVPFFIYGSYNNSFILAAAIVSVAHFFIDAGKIHYERSHDKKNVSFVIDQLCHFGVIVIVSHLFRRLSINIPPYIQHPILDDFYDLYTNLEFVIFLPFAIFVTKGLEVYHFQKLWTQDNSLKFKPRYLKMIFRLILFTAITGILLYLFIVSFRG